MAARPDPLVASGGRPATSRAPTETTDQPVPRHAVAGEDRQDLLQIGRIGQGQDALLLLGGQAGMSENITYVITAHLGHVTPIRLWPGRPSYDVGQRRKFRYDRLGVGPRCP